MFPCCWVVRLFYIFHQVFYQTYVLQILYIYKYIHIQGYLNFLMFSYRIVQFFCFTFKYMSDVQLLFYCEMFKLCEWILYIFFIFFFLLLFSSFSSSSLFWVCGCPVIPVLFVEKIFCFSLNCPCYLVNDEFTIIYLYKSIYGLFSLFHWSLCLLFHHQQHAFLTTIASSSLEVGWYKSFNFVVFTQFWCCLFGIFCLSMQTFQSVCWYLEREYNLK